MAETPIRHDSVDAYLVAGDAFFDAADYARAADAYGAAVRLDADHLLANYNLGTALMHAGRNAEAVPVFQAVLARRSGFVQAAYNLALIFQADQRLDDAIEHYWRAILASPSFAPAHRNLGVIFRELGRNDEAATCFRKLLRLDPEDPDTYADLGAVLKLAEHLEEAAAAYQEALDRRPNFPAARFKLGTIMLELDRPTDALAAFDSVLEQQPDFPEAHVNRGFALRSLRRDEEAAECNRRALAIRPNYPRARTNLADCYQALGRHSEAIEQYRIVISDDPDSFAALNHLGVALVAAGQFDEAIETLNRAIALRPDNSLAHTHLGIAHARVAHQNEALFHYRQGVTFGPSSALAWCNLGAGLHDLGAFAEAIQCFQQSVALDPVFAAAHTNEGITRLLSGDYARGWPKYEWRLRRDDPAGPRPLYGDGWDGEEELDGKVLLLHAEQGLGDTIQLCRFIGGLRASGARIVCQLPETLHELMAESYPDIELYAMGVGVPVFDTHKSLMSLPLVLKTRVETIPANVPYLRARSEVIVKWRQLLPAGRKPRVGLVWAGGAAYPNDHLRSMPFAAAKPLAELGEIHLISLQKEIPANDLAMVEACPRLHRLGEQVSNFSDSAAIVASLDLVISVDTSVAHLAGAMACPVWVMLPYIPDWRWLIGRDDSPWYPTARLFRQERLGDWAGVVERVKAALLDWTSHPR